MNETTGKRIAFVVNARTGDELQAGNRDSSRLWTLLTDPNLGRCEPIYPPLHNCENEFSFLKELKEILKKLNSSDQLLFYFSGHGIVKNQQYCIKLGLDEDSYYPFKNLINQLRVSGIERAIIIIDACHSGKILSEIGTKKNEFNPLENLELELPKGIAIIASCQESQKSYELPDSSSSVFTHLLCQAIEGGLDGQATPNSLISISDVIGYIQKQLETNKIYKSYPQKPIFTINGANQDIWIAKNKSGLQEIDNNIVHNSKIISSAFQNLLVEQLQSIKKEIITDVKLTSLDETTQNTLKDLSDKVSNIQAIVGSLSIGKEGGSISQYQEKVEQLEIKIKEYEGQEERHFTRIRELNDERDRLLQNLTEQRQQIEQFSSGEVEQLRQQNQELYSSYQNQQKLLYNVNIEKVQLEQQATTLNSRVHQLQQDKKDLELKVQTNVQDIEALKKEIKRLRKLLNKEAIETGDIPRQWQNIINSYNQSPDAILNIHGVHKQGESDKVSNIQAIVGSLSIDKEGGSISQYQEEVRLLQNKIQEYEEQKERHLTRIRELNDERNRLSQNLTEQRQQIEQFSSGEVEQLRQQNQELYSSYQNQQKLLYNVNIEKVQLEQQATTLNSRVHQLQQDKKDLELKVQTNVQDIEALKKEIKRLRKLLNKEAIETGDIPRQWQNIINSYNQSPDAILNIHGVHKQGEVVEDEDKGAERRNNSSKPVVLTSNVSPDGFYIVLVGNDYLLFPKQHAIAASQKFTVSALFDGYRSGNTSKFTLISPAQVTPVGSSGMWQLKHKGKLEYN